MAYNQPVWHLLLFRTRKECALWIKGRYGYLKDRPDLRAEPHGFRLPKPVKVRVTATVIEPDKRSKLEFPQVISRTSRGETVRGIVDYKGREIK